MLFIDRLLICFGIREWIRRLSRILMNHPDGNLLIGEGNFGIYGAGSAMEFGRAI